MSLMNEISFTPILLAIVGFIGALMVKQLMKIAESVKSIHTDLKVLTNDHSHLKDAHDKLEKRVDKLEI